MNSDVAQNVHRYFGGDRRSCVRIDNAIVLVRYTSETGEPFVIRGFATKPATKSVDCELQAGGYLLSRYPSSRRQLLYTSYRFIITCYCNVSRRLGTADVIPYCFTKQTLLLLYCIAVVVAVVIVFFASYRIADTRVFVCLSCR